MNLPFANKNQYIDYLIGRIKHHVGVDDETVNHPIVNAKIIQGDHDTIYPRRLSSRELAEEIVEGLDQWRKGVQQTRQHLEH